MHSQCLLYSVIIQTGTIFVCQLRCWSRGLYAICWLLALHGSMWRTPHCPTWMWFKTPWLGTETCTGNLSVWQQRHQTLWSQHMILFQKQGMAASLTETDSSCIAARSLCFQCENIKTNHPTSCKKLVIDNQTDQDDTMWYHDNQLFFGTHQWPTRIISNIIGLGRGSSTRALSSCSTTGGV